MSGTQTPDLTIATALDEFIGNFDSGLGMETRRATAANIAKQIDATLGLTDSVGALSTTVASVDNRVDALEAGQTSGSLAFSAWTALNAVAGTGAGERAEVYGDAGTHTDPVVGGTVANSGVFSWSVSPAGWQWLSANTYVELLQFATESGDNLLSRSNDFSNVAWTKSQATVPTVSGVSPAGGSVIYKLTDNGSNDLHYALQYISGAQSSGSVIVFSLYAMADTLSKLMMWVVNGSDDAKKAVFDVAAGKAYTLSGTAEAGVIPIDEFPGWYRCWIKITLDSANTPGLFIMTADDDGLVTYAGTSQAIKIAGAMASVGKLYPYIDTTSAAATRNVSRESERGAAAFAEEAATGARVDTIDTALSKVSHTEYVNYILHSDDFTHADWTAIYTAALPGAVPAPHGNIFATKLAETADTNIHTITQIVANSIGAGSPVSYSICAKAADRSQIMGWFKAQNDTDPQKVLFDLASGTATPDTINPPIDAPLITPIDGMPGWYRCTIVGRALTAGTTQIFWLIGNGGSINYAGTSGMGVYIANAQMYVGTSVKPFAATTTSPAQATQSIYAAADHRQINYASGVGTGFGLLDDTPTLYICASNGQSNAAGYGTGSLVATSALNPGYALMGSTGVHAQGQRFTTLVDLVESVGSPAATTETAGSGWINKMLELTQANFPVSARFAYFNPAIGGLSIAELKRGTPSYARFIGALQDMDGAARRAGYRPVFLALDWMGNESDTSDADGVWQHKIKQLRRQMDEDIRRVTGQTENWMFFLSTIRTGNGNPFGNPVFIGDRQAADSDPGIKLGVPTYHLPSNSGVVDNVHMTCIGQNRRGQALGYAVFAEMFGAGWTPFHENRVWRSGAAEIAIAFQLPNAANLVLDTSGSIVPNSGYPAGNYYGFRFDDGSGSPPTITGHAFYLNQMFFTLSGTPSGHAGRVSYATDIVIANSNVSGCLRSDHSSTLLYGLGTEYDWCHPFIAEFPL